jgi:hypothetical protein
MTTLIPLSLPRTNKRLFATLAIVTLVWLFAYNVIQPLADWISYSQYFTKTTLESDSSLALWVLSV